MNSIEFLAIRKLQQERGATDYEAAQFLDQVNAGTSDHEAALEMAMVEVNDDSYRPEGYPTPKVQEVASRPNGETRQPDTDEEPSTKDLIIWQLVSLAKLPVSVATLVRDGADSSNPELGPAAIAALGKIGQARLEPDDIPL